MKPDLYTKAVFTVIAIMLTAIACNQYIEPKVAAQAQAAPFAGVQFSATGSTIKFFDTRTGDLWGYVNHDTLEPNSDHYEWEYWGKTSKLGQPFVGGLIDVDGIPKRLKKK